MQKKPDYYIYPAVFSYDDDGVAVSFPDLPGCVTYGDNQIEAVYMAVDVLGGHLSCLEDDNDVIPMPSDLREIHTELHDVIVLIEAWMPPFREKNINYSNSFFEQTEKELAIV